MDAIIGNPMPKMSGAEYVPKEGDVITVYLPDERTRATIERVISDTAVIAKIMQYTTAKISHSYKKGDLVACQFEPQNMNQMGWRAVSERELEESTPAPPPPEPVAKAPKKKKGK